MRLVSKQFKTFKRDPNILIKYQFGIPCERLHGYTLIILIYEHIQSNISKYQIKTLLYRLSFLVTDQFNPEEKSDIANFSGSTRSKT